MQKWSYFALTDDLRYIHQKLLTLYERTKKKDKRSLFRLLLDADLILLLVNKMLFCSN
jgi:hypothetical protein